MCFGDLDQKEPIERGAVMAQCARRYGAANFSYLTMNHRVASESQLIARNVARIRDGDVGALEFSEDLASEHAFVMVERSTLERDVRRVREHCGDALVVTQRNPDRALINRAYRVQDAPGEYKPHVLYAGERVMFLENYYAQNKKDTPPAMREHSVMNGTMGVLERFEDVTPVEFQ